MAVLCHPPTPQEWILILGVTVVVFVGLFFTLVRMVQRRHIDRDRSATLGRHRGIFLALLLSLVAMMATGFGLTGCLHPRFVLWVAVLGAITAVDGLYTLIMVRNQ